jgi:hypothetical protein
MPVNKANGHDLALSNNEGRNAFDDSPANEQEQQQQPRPPPPVKHTDMKGKKIMCANRGVSDLK